MLNNLLQMQLKLLQKDIITKISKTSPQNNSKTITNKEKTNWLDSEKEIPRETYTSPEKRQKIIDNIRFI